MAIKVFLRNLRDSLLLQSVNFETGLCVLFSSSARQAPGMRPPGYVYSRGKSAGSSSAFSILIYPPIFLDEFGARFKSVARITG